jgi:microcystin-dependent protein
MTFNFPPKGWAFCNGQLLPINQNQALFSLLGTTYGGDGRVTFGLPNLQGRAPMHFGDGHTLGETGGEANHTLTVAETPPHSHQVNVSNATTGGTASPAGAFLGGATNAYLPGTPTATLSPSTVGIAGGSQQHPNQQPYLALSFCIALQGIFPSQN